MITYPCHTQADWNGKQDVTMQYQVLEETDCTLDPETLDIVSWAAGQSFSC